MDLKPQGDRAAVGSAGGLCRWAAPVLAVNMGLQQSKAVLSSHNKPRLISVKVTPGGRRRKKWQQRMKGKSTRDQH